MALVVNTNIPSIVAQGHASASRKEMELAMERLSSGQRVNSASDDAAGLAISTRLDAQVRGMSMAVNNANNAISLTQTAEGAQKEITEMLQRIRELAVQSTSSTNSSDDRASLDAEVQELIEEINAIATTTSFNGQNLLDGTFGASVQIGAEVGRTMEFSFESVKTSDLGFTGAAGGSSSSVISGRVTLGTAIANGDIKINGESIGAITTTMDITDVVQSINDNVSTVTASAFNTVVMDDVGTGVTTDGQVVVAVELVDTASTSMPDYQYFAIDASTDLADLASNINDATEGLVTASVNADGKLVFSNDTGAGIHIVDQTSGSKATGLGDQANVTASTTADNDGATPSTTDTAATNNARTFEGFINITSNDDAALTIDYGSGSDGGYGAAADLALLGLTQVGVNQDTNSTYSITGRALTAPTTAYNVGDLVINGIDVFNADLDSDTFTGKLNSINAKTDETGVTASAQFDYYIDLSSHTLANGATVQIVVDDASSATQFDMAATAADIASAMDTALDAYGLSVDLIGNQLRIYGDDVEQLEFYIDNATDAAAHVASSIFGSTATTLATASGTTYAAIQLESEDGSAITIELGEDATIATHGFYETNVGAADFDSNEATTDGATGSSVADLSVATATAAENALSIIDQALQQVSDSSSNMGAFVNRLDHVVANLEEAIVNTSAARSRIMDADFAVESSRLAKQQVLQQAATAMLAQANAAPQSVLTLLGA